MLSRWQTHVEGWLNLAERNPKHGISVLCYEELNLEFEATVKKIAQTLGQDREFIQKPQISENVIGSGPGEVGRHREHLDEDDLAFIWDEVGDTMTRLKYLP